MTKGPGRADRLVPVLFFLGGGMSPSSVGCADSFSPEGEKPYLPSPRRGG